VEIALVCHWVERVPLRISFVLKSVFRGMLKNYWGRVSKEDEPNVYLNDIVISDSREGPKIYLTK